MVDEMGEGKSVDAARTLYFAKTERFYLRRPRGSTVEYLCGNLSSTFSSTMMSGLESRNWKTVGGKYPILGQTGLTTCVSQHDEKWRGNQT